MESPSVCKNTTRIVDKLAKLLAAVRAIEPILCRQDIDVLVRVVRNLGDTGFCVASEGNISCDALNETRSLDLGATHPSAIITGVRIEAIQIRHLVARDFPQHAWMMQKAVKGLDTLARHIAVKSKKARK